MKKKSVKIARLRLNELLSIVSRDSDEVLRKEALKLAIDINSKFNLKQSFSAKKGFCKKCYKKFNARTDYRVRIRNKTKVITCINCKQIYRYKL